ncbi:MAG: endonuclease/exonuclease/phosphatase family protein [Bacteroidota bacterium]|nr:endonuclease/exonuclease/phosphatase family protein [Bacteroidota bacterium]
MKIATWNCNMAYRKKAGFILAHTPDIVIIPECECPEKLKFNADTILPNDIFWKGSHQHKRLGIFSYGNYRFKLLDNYNPELKTILPLAVTGGKFDFTLFAIWANNPQDKNYEYVGQVWKALQHYDTLLKKERTILIGDFNSNSIWDKPKREGNHSTVVKHLEQKGIYSTYHKHYNQIQGKEEHSTLFMYRHQNKPYHIDYCFASIDLIDKLKNVEIGSYEEWTKYSDHKPVIVTFDV